MLFSRYFSSLLLFFISNSLFSSFWKGFAFLDFAPADLLVGLQVDVQLDVNVLVDLFLLWHHLAHQFRRYFLVAQALQIELRVFLLISTSSADALLCRWSSTVASLLGFSKNFYQWIVWFKQQWSYLFHRFLERVWFHFSDRTPYSIPISFSSHSIVLYSSYYDTTGKDVWELLQQLFVLPAQLLETFSWNSDSFFLSCPAVY